MGGEVLIIKDEHTIFHESFGWFDKEHGKKMMKGAVYHTASMSKPFSTTLILQLAEQGFLSIDDPVQKFIPNFPNESVKIKNLMNHTSGYSGWGPDGENHKNLGQYKNLSDWIIAWTDMGPKLPVGTHHYTNYNNAALMLIAQEATGKSAKELTEKNILRPLKLENTFVFPVDQAVSKNIPPLYIWSTDKATYGKIESFNDLNWPAYAGAFGIFSNTKDYALLMQYWMQKGSYQGHTLLKNSSVEQAFSSSNPNIIEDDDSYKYGFGWRFRVSEKNNMPLEFNHGGIMRSYAIAFPSENAIVVYATHSWKRRSHREAFMQIIKRLGLFDVQPGPNFIRTSDRDIKFLSIDAKDSKKYCGTYTGTIEGADMNLKMHLNYGAGQLISKGKFTNQTIPTFNTLSFVDDQTAYWAIQHNGQILWFNPDLEIHFLKGDGHVTGYEVHQNGELEIKLTKTKNSH